MLLVTETVPYCDTVIFRTWRSGMEQVTDCGSEYIECTEVILPPSVYLRQN